MSSQQACLSEIDREVSPDCNIKRLTISICVSFRSPASNASAICTTRSSNPALGNSPASLSSPSCTRSIKLSSTASLGAESGLKIDEQMSERVDVDVDGLDRCAVMNDRANELVDSPESRNASRELARSLRACRTATSQQGGTTQTRPATHDLCILFLLDQLARTGDESQQWYSPLAERILVDATSSSLDRADSQRTSLVSDGNIARCDESG